MFKSDDQLKQFLENVKMDDTPNPSHRDALEQQLLEAYARRQPSEQKSVWRTIMKNRITKFTAAAAMLVAVFGIFFFFGRGESSIYAKAMEVIDNAKTLHVSMREYHNNQLLGNHEFWYDRDAGLLEKVRYPNRTLIRLDNGQYEWRYSADDFWVAKISSYRDMDKTAKEFTFEWKQYTPHRDPARDRVVQGINYHAYCLSQDLGSKYVWIDPQYCVREFEMLIKVGDSEIRAEGIAEFNIPIDQNLLRPDFDPKMTIIDPANWIEEKFSLENAIFTQERLGMIFAVHELKPCGENLQYMVCSSRLTEKSRKEIGNIDPWTYYGGFEVMADWAMVSKGDRTYWAYRLAKMTHQGIQVDWYILIPWGNTDQSKPCDVEIHTNAGNILQEICKAEGLPIADKFTMKIPDPPTDTPILLVDDISREIFSLGKFYDPLVHSFSLMETTFKQDPEWQPVSDYRRPVLSISEESFIQNVRDSLDEIMKKR